jgi:hypothetical protein
MQVLLILASIRQDDRDFMEFNIDLCFTGLHLKLAHEFGCFIATNLI